MIIKRSVIIQYLKIQINLNLFHAFQFPQQVVNTLLNIIFKTLISFF